jgi:hypothetical protein
VETRVLVQAVKRNLRRFPADFMFQLSKDEFENWRSQFVMSNPGSKMGLRRRPYAFTGADQPHDRLKRALRAEIDEAACSTLYTTNRPFRHPK